MTGFEVLGTGLLVVVSMFAAFGVMRGVLTEIGKEMRLRANALRDFRLNWRKLRELGKSKKSKTKAERRDAKSRKRSGFYVDAAEARLKLLRYRIANPGPASLPFPIISAVVYERVAVGVRDQHLTEGVRALGNIPETTGHLFEQGFTELLRQGVHACPTREHMAKALACMLAPHGLLYCDGVSYLPALYDDL